MQVLTWEQFVSNVQAWASERGIYEHSTPEAQLLKTLSELGELADAVIKSDTEGLKDAIGDVAVCLVNYSAMKGFDITEQPEGDITEVDLATTHGLIGLSSIYLGQLVYPPSLDYTENLTVYVLFSSLILTAQLNNLDFLDCCTHAWNSIKNRRGKMVAGGAFVKD